MKKKINKFINSFKNRNNKVYAFYTVFISFIYFPLISQHFAMTDDYSVIDIAIRKLKALLDWDVVNGRPMYGIMQYFTQSYMTSIENLSWLRFFSVISTIILCCFIYKFLILKVKSISQNFIIFLPIFVVLLPPIVVYNAWSVCFVYVLSILLSGIAYYYIYDDDRKTTVGRFIVGVLILICSFLIYQPTAMMFLYFVFLNTCIDSRKINFTNLFISAFALLIGMFAALFAIKILPKLLYGHLIERSSFSSDLIFKIDWFFYGPLKIAINNYNITASIIYTFFSIFLIIIGCCYIYRRYQGILKLLLTIILMIGIMTPALLAKESWIATRSSVGLYFIIATIILYGLIAVYEKFLSKYKAKVFLNCMLFVIGIYTQHYIYSAFIRQQQSEYQALVQEIMSKLPQQYNGLIRFNISNPVEGAFTKISLSDEIGHTSVQTSWALRGIAQSIKKIKGLHYQIDNSDLILKPNDNCVDNCIIINVADVLRKAENYK